MKYRMAAMEKITMTVVLGVNFLAFAAMVIVALKSKDLAEATVVILAAIPSNVISGLFGFLVGGSRKDAPPQLQDIPTTDEPK